MYIYMLYIHIHVDNYAIAFWDSYAVLLGSQMKKPSISKVPEVNVSLPHGLHTLIEQKDCMDPR
jgi:hypothetical protein